MRDELIDIAKKYYSVSDPSHDFQHILRVLHVAEELGKEEGADIDIIMASALFHDVITYSKDDPRNKNATEESAVEAKKVLESISNFPKEKISAVMNAISLCSFSKGLESETLEGKILQDADRLEACGAISIMRTFASSGLMKRAFYDPEDPFAESRELNDLRYSVDLFKTRLLKVSEKMHTKSAKKMAERRTEFLKKFLEELKSELEETGVLTNA